MSGEDATEHVEVEELDLAHNHWELQVVQEGRREFRYPFFDESFDLGVVAAGAFPEGAPWTVTLEPEGIRLTHRPSEEEHILRVGESLQVENRRLWLIDVRRPPLGTLEGTTSPFAGRVWHLKSHQSWLGRRGKRLNHIELDHPTISRTHATLTPDSSGRFTLLSESAQSPTTVNGQPVAPGETCQLSHGDLLGFGQLLFRFSAQVNSESDESGIFVQTLGGFRVSLGTESSPEVLIKSEKARWLLAAVAAKWDSPLPVEPLIESFWPGVAPTRGRKNLSYTLSQLKEAFKSKEIELEALLFRSPSEFRLNPERLGRHDFVEVSKLVRDRKALTSESALNRLLSLHQGPFLGTCYETWAEELRLGLERDLQETLTSTCQYFLEKGEHQLVQIAAKKLLEMEATNESAVKFLMESHLQLAQPEEAAAAFQALEKVLKSEELEPSIELVKLFHRARLGL